MEKELENEFNPEEFRSDLEKKTRQYIYSRTAFTVSDNVIETDIKTAKVKALYSELVDYCMEALLASDDSMETMNTINEILVNHTHQAGMSLFDADKKIQFYQDLSLCLARKFSSQ